MEVDGFHLLDFNGYFFGYFFVVGISFEGYNAFEITFFG